MSSECRKTAVKNEGRFIHMLLGRDLLFQAMKQQGIGYLFGNPGTTELPVLDGVNNHPEVTYAMALHEDIAVGMAMGYSRVTDLPGVVNLHVAPGLAHGLGNMYNAWRARIPLVVTAGQHHTHLKVQEPILTGDLVAMARPYTKWAHEVTNVSELPVVLQRAFKEAVTPPCGPVFLSLPSDVMLTPTEQAMSPITRIGSRLQADDEDLARAAAVLLQAQAPLIVAGDAVGLAGAQEQVVALAHRIGAPVYTEALSSLCNFPNFDPHWLGSLPVHPGEMRATFAGADVALLLGFSSQAPVAFFDDQGPLIPHDVRLIAFHSSAWEIGKNQYVEAGILGDVQVNLQRLLQILDRDDPSPGRTLPDAAAVSSRKAVALHDTAIETRRRDVHRRHREMRAAWAERTSAEWDQDPMSITRVAGELAAILPENAIVAAEAVSNNMPFLYQLSLRDPYDYWGSKGGGLGHAAAAALGMKLGAPERPVVNVVGDGAFMYYPQVLWTAAHLNLDIVFLILNNRSYHVLKLGFQHMGGPWGDAASFPPGMNMTDPVVDFVRLAAAMGVAGERVIDGAKLRPVLERGLAGNGPFVVEAVIGAAL